MPSQHVILRIINGRTQLPTRSFTRGEPVPQFSVGSRGDWIVSGPGISSFHVLLTFDGEHVFAASADPATAPVYLQGSPIGNTWHAVTPSTELRFGGASLVVAREASIAPAAGASPPRPPKPEHRDVPLPPVTVRQAAEAAKHTGPGNTQFFEDLQAQVGAGTGSAPPPPAASAEAMMAAIAPTLARQPPVTFPMEPPSNAASPFISASPFTSASPSTPALPSTPASGGVQSAAPPPLISAPGPLLPSAPAAAFPMESFPTAFAPQFPGDTSSHLPDLPLTNLPAANLPTLASDSFQGNQASATGWSGGRALELPTHFAPPGSVALPPGAAPTAIAPTDDGAPLPLGLPFAVPPANAEGEPFSTVAADADAIRNFAAHLPPSPPDPPLPPMDAGYPHPYMQGQTPMPGLNAGYPTSLENQTPPPAYAAPRFSHNPRAPRGQGGKWVLLVLLPLGFAVIVVALAFYVIAR